MKFLNNLFVLGVLAIGSLVSSCQEPETSSYYERSSASSKDTIPKGTPKGMYLYLNKENLIPLEDLIKEKEWDKEKLVGISIEQIRVKINKPEKDFDPENIQQISTSFSLGDGEQRVVQLDHYSYSNQTYHINVNSDIKTLQSDEYSDLNVQGGFALKTTLEQPLVVTTEIEFKAEIRK